MNNSINNNCKITFAEWDYLKKCNFIWAKSGVKHNEKDRVAYIDYNFTIPPRKPSIEEPDGFGGIYDPNTSFVYIPKFLYKNFRDNLRHDLNIAFKDVNYKDVNYENLGQTTNNFKVSFEPREEQEEAFKVINKIWSDQNQINGLVKAKPGWGKEQPYSSKILKPDGSWTTMGELKNNDFIIGKDGKPTQVIGIFEQGIKDVYELTFLDGTKAECGLDHLWYTYRRGVKKENQWAVRSLKEILPLYLKEQFDKRYGTFQRERKIAVPLCDPIDFINPNITLNIPPLLLGLLLGDGCFRSNSYVIFSDKFDKNIDIVKENLFLIDPEYTLKKYENDWKISSKILIKYLKEYNLWNKLSVEKHIPKDYLLSNVENRKLLLEGLFKTDEWFSKHSKKNIKIKSSRHYTTSSKQLKNDFLELTRGLGYHSKVNIIKNNLYTYKGKTLISPNTNYDINVNMLKNKKFIDNIELVRKENSRCIKVCAKDSLYITDDYTVTHNTFFSIKTISNLQLRTVVVVPTGILQQQWMDSIVKFSNISKADIGIIDGSDLNKKSNLNQIDKDVNVIMIQTLLSILKVHGYDKMQEYFSRIGLVIYDECHKSGAAEGFSKTVPMFKTDNIIGLSATPFRQDINLFLLNHNMGNMLYESNHQNLIPEVHLRRYMLNFDDKQINRLQFMMTDYIKFMAIYNKFLSENENYVDYIAQWVNYRYQQGHEIVVLFSTNKLVENLKIRLKAYGLNEDFVGTLTGKTEKHAKLIQPKITQEHKDIILTHYLDTYPRKKKLPNIEVGKNYTKVIKQFIEDINDYIISETSEEIIIIPEPILEESEMVIAKQRPIVLSNYLYLSDGFDKETLSNMIFGSPIKGLNGLVQTLGRVTRKNPDKIQEVQADFILSNILTHFFPRIHWDIFNNIKKEYDTAKINFENFDEVFEKQKKKEGK